MKSLLKISLLLFCICGIAYAQQNNNASDRSVLPADVQIRIAVQAAPESFREGAKVYGYSPEGEFITLREGDNGYICLAPDYRLAMYYAYCYPESLEPFMKRGRELTAEGKRKERDQIREAEFKAGTLDIPQGPTTLYGYWGSADQLNPETGEMGDAKRRYVIYVPYAKAADFGLSNKPNNIGMPWLMDEGSYKAHIMITPPLDHQH